MKAKVSKGGQISLPAEIRRRWATDFLVLEDLGDRVVLRPIPKDPIAAAEGSLRSRISSDQARARARKQEEERFHARVRDR